MTNVANNISIFYGANPWHFYLSQALPFDTLALMPFVAHGCFLSRLPSTPAAAKVIRNAALFTTVCFSLISHKEFRFVMPLLPIMHVFAALSLVRGASDKDFTYKRWSVLPSIRRSHALFVLGINIPAAVLFMMVHMRGQVSVSTYLHRARNELHDTTVGFLMPCHSTPWASHIHHPGATHRAGQDIAASQLWAITCEPPLGYETSASCTATV